MPGREEALRRILEATGTADRLTAEQRREILAHLEDSVEAKVSAGAAEMDAVGHAFQELGDLRKISRGFPEQPAGAVTADGRILAVWTRNAGLGGFILLAIFAWIQLLMTNRAADMFRTLHVKAPALTQWIFDLSFFMRAFSPVTFIGLALVGLLLLHSRRKPWGRALALSAMAAGMTLCLAVLFAVSYPLLTLLQGVQS